MGLDYSTSTNYEERQGRAKDKQEGGSKERSKSIDCSGKEIEHGHEAYVNYAGIQISKARKHNWGVSFEPATLPDGQELNVEYCPKQPDGKAHYKNQQNQLGGR